MNKTVLLVNIPIKL